LSLAREKRRARRLRRAKRQSNFARMGMVTLNPAPKCPKCDVPIKVAMRTQDPTRFYTKCGGCGQEASLNTVSTSWVARLGAKVGGWFRPRVEVRR
jgi:hypothetical protein